MKVKIVKTCVNICVLKSIPGMKMINGFVATVKKNL